MSSKQNFSKNPIINSPYRPPERHWELENGQPTGKIIDRRRDVSFISPIPRPKGEQGSVVFDERAERLSTDKQQYDLADTIKNIRRLVNEWRNTPEEKWGVTPETASLLNHWRTHDISYYRPFFCQIEAVETAVWLHEVAPNSAEGKRILRSLTDANEAANESLFRLALKLATGAGKTTVMAMLIAWHAINAARHPRSTRFTCGFLIVTPGITIKDRLRVLLPNDPDSYYKARDLVPRDMLEYVNQAKIVITNFHAFKLKEQVKMSKGTRDLLRGRRLHLNSMETEGQMIKRVMSELMSFKNIVVFNDEAHHCYREKQKEGVKRKGEDIEAKKNREKARLWISGLEAVQSKMSLKCVFDLSATPFFLSGSGYAEGTLFPWTVSDFSLMDAIESGIVKLPRVPVSDDIPGEEYPKLRNLWKHIGKEMPKGTRSKKAVHDPRKLPLMLQNALKALYGHYEKTYEKWHEEGHEIDPCFIIICNSTASSKLVYDYVSGFGRQDRDGEEEFSTGRLALFSNYDNEGKPLARPRTLLIDSEQLESGEALDKSFRSMAAEEIERFERERKIRNPSVGDKISDADLLREVMNTVGKQGQLGSTIRCVVSVSMLTEGWDANTVTHIFGLRAFGTQLLCEQAVGRALRRLSYATNEKSGLSSPEYADILGIPFDFTAEPTIAPVVTPAPPTFIKAISPERDSCEIKFPMVVGYRKKLPEDRLEAKFGPDSDLTLTRDMVGPIKTRLAGLIGPETDITLVNEGEVRDVTLAYNLAGYLIENKLRDADEKPKHHLFGQIKNITLNWIANHLHCEDRVHKSQLMYSVLADIACERIIKAIYIGRNGDGSIVAELGYNKTGTTKGVNFPTSAKKNKLFAPRGKLCHLNYLVCDSNWERRFCKIVEREKSVVAYVKNHGLGLEVPYIFADKARTYIPDFIVLVNDGNGADDLLHLIVEIKGLRKEDAKEKKMTMDAYWIPGVNALGTHGRWAFGELRDEISMQRDFRNLIRD